jgi:hypothetical protein
MLRQLRQPAAIGGLLLLTLLPAPLARPAAAHAAGGLIAAAGDHTAEPEKWWGVAGAALCGGGVRLIRIAPEIGMNPYVLAATIGGCILAVMDQA